MSWFMNIPTARHCFCCWPPTLGGLFSQPFPAVSACCGFFCDRDFANDGRSKLQTQSFWLSWYREDKLWCMMRRKFLVSPPCKYDGRYWIHGPRLRNLTVHSAIVGAVVQASKSSFAQGRAAAAFRPFGAWWPDGRFFKFLVGGSIPWQSSHGKASYLSYFI